MAAKAVFLSYASQDAEAVARVAAGLEAAGVEVWFDKAELKGGDAWDAAIRRRIKECTLFLPIVSAATDARDEGYFRLEWKLAIDRSHLMAGDKAFLMPVMLDGTSQNAARVPDRFREVHWSRASTTEEIAAFARDVVRLLEGSPLAGAPAAETTARATMPSIAVLPFVNMSRDEENEYFADGLSEELLNVLARIRGLRVASRTSAFSFKGKGMHLSHVARQLGVAHILEGSVRKSGNRVRITAQLIEAASDSHLWSQTYDRTLDDIFAVQDDIAQAVVVELRRRLLGEEPAPDRVASEVQHAAAGRSADAEAQRLYMQSRFFAQRATRQDTALALAYIEQAIARDATFASAWAGLSTVSWSQGQHGWVAPAQAFERARIAARRALELEPDLPEALVALSRVLILDRDWHGAGVQLDRALAIAPANGQVLRAIARLVAYLGRLDEGIAYLRRAVELDPLSFAGYFNMAGLLAFSGRYDEAEASLLRARDLNPSGGAWRTGLAVICLLRGDAVRAAEESRQEINADMGLTLLAMSQHSLGHREESDKALARLLQDHGERTSYNIATVHAWRGEVESAFNWLERAYANRDPSLGDVAVDPFLVSLRGDPRWLALVRRMGLPA